MHKEESKYRLNPERTAVYVCIPAVDPPQTKPDRCLPPDTADLTISAPFGPRLADNMTLPL